MAKHETVRMLERVLGDIVPQSIGYERVSGEFTPLLRKASDKLTNRPSMRNALCKGRHDSYRFVGMRLILVDASGYVTVFLLVLLSTST